MQGACSARRQAGCCRLAVHSLRDASARQAGFSAASSWHSRSAPSRHEPGDEAVHRQPPLPAAPAVARQHALDQLQPRRVAARVEAAPDGLDDGLRTPAGDKSRKLRTIRHFSRSNTTAPDKSEDCAHRESFEECFDSLPHRRLPLRWRPTYPRVPEMHVPRTLSSLQSLRQGRLLPNLVKLEIKCHQRMRAARQLVGAGADYRLQSHRDAAMYCE